MTVEPAAGLHVLRNTWMQRSRLAEDCRALAAGLDAAIRATRLAVPRRAARGKDFRIDAATHGVRKGIDAIDPRSQERRMEALLYAAYGPAGAASSTEVWSQLIAFQVPLFDRQSREGWGHIDLLALARDGRPIVIELKKQDSTETPLRAIVEGLANAIAVEECWPALSEEIRAMCARRGLACAVAAAAAPVTVVALAPAAYWSHWQQDGGLGPVAAGAARDEFRSLREAIAAAGYPTRLATFDWPFDGNPRVRAANVSW